MPRQKALAEIPSRESRKITCREIDISVLEALGKLVLNRRNGGDGALWARRQKCSTIDGKIAISAMSDTASMIARVLDVGSKSSPSSRSSSGYLRRGRAERTIA
jgi:hypothetical protein